MKRLLIQTTFEVIGLPKQVDWPSNIDQMVQDHEYIRRFVGPTTRYTAAVLETRTWNGLPPNHEIYAIFRTRNDEINIFQALQKAAASMISNPKVNEVSLFIWVLALLLAGHIGAWSLPEVDEV